jgi:hypothetical protein
VSNTDSGRAIVKNCSPAATVTPFECQQTVSVYPVLAAIQGDSCGGVLMHFGESSIITTDVSHVKVPAPTQGGRLIRLMASVRMQVFGAPQE